MSNLVEAVQGLVITIINLIAGLIALVAGVFVDLGQDKSRPAWTRITAIGICFAILGALAWVFWDYIAVLAAVLLGLLIITSWLMS